jgi:hypothetical protein
MSPQKTADFHKALQLTRGRTERSGSCSFG